MNETTDYEQIPDEVAEALNHAARVVHDWARQKGWWDRPKWQKSLEDFSAIETCPDHVRAAIAECLAQPSRNKGELIGLMHSELSEGLEALRKNNPPDDKVPELPGETAELADTLIRIFDYAGAFGLDIGGAVQMKHAFNCGRPYRHGKAF